jgi:hypothetical protein
VIRVSDPADFAIDFSLNTMAHIVKPIPRQKTVKGIPMDRLRAMADESAIDAHYKRTSGFGPGTRYAFVVNVEESRFADYTDARPEIVVNVRGKFRHRHTGWENR